MDSDSSDSSDSESYKLSRKDIRGAIRTAYFKEKLTPLQIKAKFKVNIKTVRKWINRDSVEPLKKTRKKVLKRQHKNYIFKLANGKFSGNDNASIRKITQKVKRKFKLKISKFPVQTYLKQAFNKQKKELAKHFT
jgi:transposase